jgi:uridine kinase
MNKKHTPNESIENYLDYYCGLQEAPKLAILLKGKWGSGKTWFIKKYHERLNKAEKSVLYKSLSDIRKELSNWIWKKKAATKINRCLYIIGLWTNLKQKMDERAITGEKISDMRNRSTDDLGVLK